MSDFAAPQHQRRRVVLLMHNWAGYVHRVLWGISEYVLHRPQWTCSRVVPLPQHIDSLLEGRRADGIITYVERDYLPKLQKLRIPIVDVSNWLPEQTFPRVLPDDLATGKLAAECLMDLGLKNFGVIGRAAGHWSKLRTAGFAQCLAKAKHEADVFHPQTLAPRPTLKISADVNAAVFAWLLKIPKPAGIYATHDQVAEEVLEVCRRVGIRVPEDVCVLGTDNDELAVKLCRPPLSSIALPADRIGFEAARLLDSLMSGAKPPSAPVLLPPVGVVARQSTNVLNIPDEDVLAAVRYIREHVHERVDVRDVLESVPVNRRYLERKFRQHVGRTPLQEIRRVRVEKAKDLLSATDLSMPAIARRSGFPNQERLATVFRSLTQMTPTAFRRQFRLRE